MHQEIPALYGVAMKICHDMGVPWTDPRTGVTYQPPKLFKPAKRKPKKKSGR